MDKRFLFSYALFTSSFLSFSLSAECTPSPDCASLGYTKSDTGCNGAPFVRCPFDTSKVACLVSVSCSDSKDGLVSSCNANEYHCTQQNFGGNVCWKKGAALTCEEKLAKGLVGCCSNSNCSGKTYCDTGSKTCKSGCYQNSQCDTGYTCNTGTHACEENKTCAVGDIYYSDKTCSANLISGKTPIGVVGKISNGGKNGIVVEKNHSSSTMPWGCYNSDLSCITNMPGSDGGSNPELRADYNGKSNTACIVQNNCSYNGKTGAGVYCNSRSVEGVTGWYLPAGGELYDTMIANKTTVNTGLGKISGATKIPSAGESYYYWSSSEYTSGYAWRWRFLNDYWYYYYKNDYEHVRCVLAF